MVDKITINCQNSIKMTGDKIIYFDPFKIEEEYKDADLIFITHDHYDHLDIDSIKKIIKEDTKVIVPNSIAVKVLGMGISNKQLLGVDPNEHYNILDYDIETVPSYNVNKKFHPKDSQFVGYIINIDGERIYVAGDTDANDDIKNIQCDIALYPIGGTFTSNYKEAAEYINFIKPKTVIPTHYATVVGGIADGVKFKELLDDDIECVLKIK